MIKIRKGTSSFLIAVFVFMFLDYPMYGQDKAHLGTGAVSEIILPVSAKIQSNFNLFYEVHISRDGIPSPSFWYKIIFNKDCSFEFTLFPLLEEDKYDFFIFKVEKNYDFCRALSEEKITSCNVSRYKKAYRDTSQSLRFRENLVDIRAVEVKANDAVYIEVFNTRGNDCGHILDFRTTDNSFVVKTINDGCAKDTVPGAPDQLRAYQAKVVDESEALGILRNVLCPANNQPLFISSIKVNEENVKVQKKLEYKAYTKAEEYKYEKPRRDSIKADKPPIPLLAMEADSQKIATIVKSTADLNDINPPARLLHQEALALSPSDEKNCTRLQVDYVLFSLLKEDLKRKTESVQQQLKAYNNAMKKADNKSKKAELIASIEETKQYKSELQLKIKNTDKKIRKIRGLLKEEQQALAQKGKKPEGSIFRKSLQPMLLSKTDSLIASGGAIPLSRQMTAGLIYKVQVGVYRNPVSTEIFKGLTPVFAETFKGGVRYSAGAFSLFSDAKLAKEYIKDIGLTDAFVVAYYNGERISIEAAKNYEGK